jgi:hypothetical protein
MKKYIWQIRLAALLIGISGLLYYAEFLIFRDGSSIFESVLSQLAFIPVYVLLVTLIIEQLLNRKERLARIEKLNVVVGVFFNELGRDLLHSFASMDKNFDSIKGSFLFSGKDFLKEFDSASQAIGKYKCSLEPTSSDFAFLKAFVIDKKEFLLLITQNPNLFEHELFTNVILSVFHLYEELSKQVDVESICSEDANHIRDDIERAYLLLITQWIKYLSHLKESYPYLFSLELRSNPFNS